jgi:hypothetical protein
MRIAARKILVLMVFFGLGLATGGADAEDAAHDRPPPPEQVARTVEGNPASPASPASPGSYAIQNDLLTGSSLADTPHAAPAAGWLQPLGAHDLADTGSDQFADFDDPVEVQVDPNEPKSIELSEGVRGKVRAKGSGALLGITVGFW